MLQLILKRTTIVSKVEKEKGGGLKTKEKTTTHRS